jgi:nitrogenase-associated protein
VAYITFYTKIGCLTSKKQLALLQEAGHQVMIQDLLAHDWTAEELRSYFGELPVQDWFNPNATRIKTGELDPELYGADEALALMQQDHLLIRRPLMESGNIRKCGFDPTVIHEWVGLAKNGDAFVFRGDLNSCTNPAVADQRPCL